MNSTKNLVTASKLPGHICIPEPLLCFHPDRPDDVEEHPLRGLRRFGPYSRATLGAVPDPIRVAAIGPRETKIKVASIIRELDARHSPRERAAYLIDYPGFTTLFGTRVVPSSLDILEIGEPNLERELPHLDLVEPLARAITALNARRSEFDVLAIYLPIRWEKCFFGDEYRSRFNLHDYIKCHAASLGIPTQIIREDKALAYRDRCSVMWRLSIALYTKSGGVPWTLADMPPETMYIGLGYAVSRCENDRPVFVTACSQVFGSDGTGFEFLGYGTKDAVVEQRENVFLRRLDMFRVLSRSLDLYQHRHAGRPPSSVVVHKSTMFTEDEIQGAYDVFGRIESLELVQIKQDSGWRGVHLEPGRTRSERSTPGYAALRGSCIPLEKFEALLWTQGNTPRVCGQNFFKEMKGTPRPLVVQRYAGHGPLSSTCKTVLAFTKMDWNNDALYNRLPVTLDFAGDLARMVRNMPDFKARPYSIRLFM